jgi:hypothetical protein
LAIAPEEYDNAEENPGSARPYFKLSLDYRQENSKTWGSAQRELRISYQSDHGEVELEEGMSGMIKATCADLGRLAKVRRRAVKDALSGHCVIDYELDATESLQAATDILEARARSSGFSGIPIESCITLLSQQTEPPRPSLAGWLWAGVEDTSNFFKKLKERTRGYSSQGLRFEADLTSEECPESCSVDKREYNWTATGDDWGPSPSPEKSSGETESTEA